MSAVAVLAAAAGTYLASIAWRGSRHVAHESLARLFQGEGSDWYDAHRRDWESREFTPLGDRAGLAVAMRAWVDGRASGPEIDPAILARDLTHFFYALAAPNPDEYLARIGNYRTLRRGTELFSDDNIHGSLNVLTGSRMSQSMSNRDVLAALWDSDRSVGRPVEVSATALVEVALAKPMPRQISDPRTVLSAVTAPDYSIYRSPEAQRYIGPFSVGFPRVTAPSTTYEAAYRSTGHMLMCNMMTVVRTSRGYAFPLNVYFYFVSAEQRWHFELAGCGSVFPAAWPL